VRDLSVPVGPQAASLRVACETDRQVLRGTFRRIRLSEREKQPQAGSLRSDKGGPIAKRTQRELGEKTVRSVVTGENFLPPTKTLRRLNDYESQCLIPLTLSLLPAAAESGHFICYNYRTYDVLLTNGLTRMTNPVILPPILRFIW